MAEDPYYWHYRCPDTGLLTRLPLFVPDDVVANVEAGKVEVPKMPCRFCGKEHQMYLEQSKFG